MSKWSLKAVSNCLQHIPLSGLPKLQTNEYKPSGHYPIIDQGQALVAAWTDDGQGLISSCLPVVVFGDHTRAFKYVDFPFVRGADGTHVLRPIPDIDPLFFYYACKAIDLPNRGYNRHFRLLQEREIPVPPRDEQHGIAGSLRSLEQAAVLQDEQLKVLADLERAAMRTLFTRGLRGEAQKETHIGSMPESWQPKTILELCEIWSGGTPTKSVQRYWDGAIPWVSGKDLKSSSLDDAIDHITLEGVEAGSRLAPRGAVLLLVRGMGLAKDLPVAVVNRSMAFNQDVKALVPRGEYSGNFIRSAIYVSKDRLLSQIVPSAHGTMTLNLNDVETFQIPCPPPQATEAEEIVAILEAIDRKIDLHRRKRAVLDDLFRTLLHKLMTGEVRVADLDLSAFDRTQATEAAA